MNNGLHCVKHNGRRKRAGNVDRKRPGDEWCMCLFFLGGGGIGKTATAIAEGEGLREEERGGGFDVIQVARKQTYMNCTSIVNDLLKQRQELPPIYILVEQIISVWLLLKGRAHRLVWAIARALSATKNNVSKRPGAWLPRREMAPPGHTGNQGCPIRTSEEPQNR